MEFFNVWGSRGYSEHVTEWMSGLMNTNGQHDLTIFNIKEWFVLIHVSKEFYTGNIIIQTWQMAIPQGGPSVLSVDPGI